MAGAIQYRQLLYDDSAFWSDYVVEDINRLLHQLSKNAPTRSKRGMREVARSETFVIAYESGEARDRVIGMALLCAVKTLHAGNLGYIHDVVVHKDYRQQGIMTKLMDMLHFRAKVIALDVIELTSNPQNVDRQKAIEGYLKMGYRKRETDVFVYDLHAPVA